MKIEWIKNQACPSEQLLMIGGVNHGCLWPARRLGCREKGWYTNNPGNADSFYADEATAKAVTEEAVKRKLGIRQQTDAEAAKQFMEYMKRKVPAVIYPAPTELADNGKIVVAPKELPTWWLGGFCSVDGARTFCKQNGLLFTEHDACPEAVEPAKAQRPRMKA